MHRMREDEAAEWGTPVEDHARYVMWAIAKNNYGPSGQRTWFEVNPASGAIAPAAIQPMHLDAQQLRAAVAQARMEDANQEFTQAQEREARAAAEEEIAMMNRMRILLRHAVREGKLATIAKAQDVLIAGGMTNVTPRRARATVEKIRMEDFVDTDGHVNHRGTTWLEEREMLE